MIAAITGNTGSQGVRIFGGSSRGIQGFTIGISIPCNPHPSEKLESL